MQSLTDCFEKFIDMTELSRGLLGAHIQIPPRKYLLYAIIATLLGALLLLIAVILVFAFRINANIFPFLPAWLSYIILCAIIISGIFISTIKYPSLVASGRKSRIDFDLPYAITYMQALSGVVTLFSLFRSVYEADDLYGEVSKECGIIVRDVELFGEDLITAMRHAQNVTPSANFADLLNDLTLVYRSGGDMTNFFASRSSSFRELAKQELESILQMLEMIAEIYVTAFVAGPIAIIIMLVAQNLSGQSQLDSLMPLMYIGLPAGSLILIAILYILLPSDNLEIAKSEIRDMEYTDDILEEKQLPETEADRKDFLKQIESRKQIIKLENILKNPFKFYISDYQYGAMAGMLLACIILLSYFNGFFSYVFPSYTFEIFICMLATGFFIPVMIAYEARRWYSTKVENQLPEFLREIADMKDVGMTLQGAITMVSKNKLGILSSELKVVSEDIKWGASTSNALIRMEERIGLVSVKRAISLVVHASEVTEHLREILTIAISDLTHYLKMKSKRYNVSFVYLAVIYLSYGIYLYAAYQLNVSFISSFENFDVSFDISSNVRDMFRIGIILGLFSGIMAGQLSSNNPLSGLKHSVIFMAVSIVLFAYIL